MIICGAISMKFGVKLIFGLIMCLLAARCDTQFGCGDIVNFDHLQHLTESIEVDDQEFSIVHIYSEYPEFKRVDAAGEGVACVDDVARAVIVYSMHYESTGDMESLSRIKPLLKFLILMQCEDGEFYNFIDQNSEINRSGITSQKSFNFWAVRAYWALGYTYRIYKDIDSAFAGKLKKSFLKCKIPLRKILEQYQKFKTYQDRQYPVWLVNEFGSDASAAMILGLCEYLTIEKDEELLEMGCRLADGIIEMQVEENHRYNGAFLSWLDTWHAWGNAQTQALARLWEISDQDKYINRARFEADNYFMRLLLHGQLNEWKYSGENDVKIYPQIAYGIRCMSLGYFNLFQATSDTRYAICAGLTASWLFGNNAANTKMYDASTGRCNDGIIDSTRVNPNAGAESTIEALMTIVEVCSESRIHPYIYATMDDTIYTVNHQNIPYQCRIYRTRDSKIGIVHDLKNDKYKLLIEEELDAIFDEK